MDVYKSLSEPHKPKSKGKSADKESVLHPGTLVLLLHDGKPAATAQVLQGDAVHGTTLPPYCVRVAIQEVKDSTTPLHFHTAFDSSEPLVSGMITAWEKYAVTKLA